jgi:hypothetical protein
MAAEGRKKRNGFTGRRCGARVPCEMKFPKFFGYTDAEVDRRADSICVICVHLRLPFEVGCGLLRPSAVPGFDQDR